MIITKLYDSGDGVTYTLFFSPKDADLILSIINKKNIKLESIGGNISVSEGEAMIMYKNGNTGMGSIFTNYSELCKQLVDLNNIVNEDNN